MFFDKYAKICELRGVAASKPILDLGMSRSTVNSWKNGVEPANRTKKLIADYLGISVEELISGTIKERHDNDVTLSDEEKAMLEDYRALPPEYREAVRASARALAQVQRKD